MDCKYNLGDRVLIIDTVPIGRCEDDCYFDDDDDDEVKRFKAMRASRLVIVRARDRSINYNLAC